MGFESHGDDKCVSMVAADDRYAEEAPAWRMWGVIFFGFSLACAPSNFLMDVSSLGRTHCSPLAAVIDQRVA